MDVGIESAPTLGDVDGDGDLDALVGERYGTIRYFENTGSRTTPSFTERTGTANPFDGVDVGFGITLTLGDVDGDGDLDAVVGETSGTIKYFENTTPPPNAPPVANNDTTTAAQNTALNISVATLLANDTDANNDPLSITGISNPTGGTAVLNDNGTPSNSADDFITFTPTSGSSDDILRGGLGNDIVSGGNGGDVFVFAAGEGMDTISDFKLGSDTIGLTGGLTFGNLSFSGSEIRLGSDVLAVLTGVNTTTLTAANFVSV